MARPGPLPKNARHGSGGTKMLDVPNTPYDGPAPELPEPPPGQAWFPQSIGWWDTLVQMPHCRLWEASDWLFALDTFYLRNDFYGEMFGGVVHTAKATELRRREDQMGMTLEARRKLGIRYIDPNALSSIDDQDQQVDEDEDDADGKPNTKVTSLRERRRRIAG